MALKPTAATSRRVGLISPCGWGNLGDAAIIHSCVEALRARQPSADVVAFTQRPSDTEWRHGIAALPIAGFSRPGYGVEPWLSKRARTTRSGWRATLSSAPGVRDAVTAIDLASSDWRFRRQVRPIVDSVSELVVTGGGQFDDLWGGPLGHPYALARWARAARSAGRRFEVASVGVGRIGSRVTRWLLADTVRHSDYLSFRDAGSRSLMGRVASEAAVVPDLAYGLPVEPCSPDTQTSGRPLVGLAPMAYRKPGRSPTPEASRYAAYLTGLANMARELIVEGCDVLLFDTTATDNEAGHDLIERLRTIDDGLLKHVEITHFERHEQLLEGLRDVATVVASRLHAVILGHVLGLPVFAISYDRKVASAMADAGHSSYCVDIESFDPSAAAAAVVGIVEDRVRLSRNVISTVESFRQRVGAQYDLLFGDVVQPTRDQADR